MADKRAIIPMERIERTILLIRGEKVILDADLAALYGVPTKALNQAVKRNRGRFPADFMFRLGRREKSEVVTNCDHLQGLKFSSGLPNAFTEHGAIMAASLSTRTGREVSVAVVRPLSACESCWPHTPTWPGRWMPWKKSTTGNSRSSLMQFDG
jgi:hypothetical protein